MAINRLRQPEDALFSKWGFQKPRRPVLNKRHPLSFGLVGCWLLGDTATGIITDLSESGNDGAVAADPIATVPSHHRGYASQFDIAGGANQYINIPNSASLNLIQVTVAAWVNYTGAGAFPRIVSKLATGAVDGYELLAFDLSSFPAFQIAKGGVINEARGSGTDLLRNQWQFVCGTYDGFEGRFYVNGELRNNFFSTNALGTTTTDINIARWPNGTNPFPGGIEGVRVYNRGLTAAEVLQLTIEPYAGIYDAIVDRKVVGTGITPPPPGGAYSYAEIWG